MNTLDSDRGPCRCCGRWAEKQASDTADEFGGIDPCIGFVIPGVSHACCGHGDVAQCYVTLGGEPGQDAVTIKNKLTLRGPRAMQFLDLVRSARAAGGTLW